MPQHWIIDPFLEKVKSDSVPAKGEVEWAHEARRQEEPNLEQ